MPILSRITAALPLLVIVSAVSAAELPPLAATFIEQRCLDCHDSETKKGNLDLTTLKFDPANMQNLRRWVTIHDRVRDGEMPPKKKPQPNAAERAAFLSALAAPMTAAEEQRISTEGRATWRRLNRYEYESTLRDLLNAPWLQLKHLLPEDGEAHRFNKVGDALDISHVQMARYLSTAETALRQVITPPRPPAASAPVHRYYARQTPSFARRVYYTQFNRSPERAVFPIIGFEADVPVLENKAPMTVGAKDPAKRELEAMGVVASSYEPIEIRFDSFTAPVSGRYKLRFSAFTFWAGPESEKRWWKPDRAKVSAGRTLEPVSIYAEMKPRTLRKLGGFDVSPEPAVDEMEVYLQADETIRTDAVGLFRSRPPNFRNPRAQPDGQPGVAYRWMEVEGPLTESGEPAMKLLFGDLPVKRTRSGMEVISKDPRGDGERLLRQFMERAYRRPVDAADVSRFTQVLEAALASGSSFKDAMITTYSAVLCSPGFLTLEEKPGHLDDHALASRLSYFLWNSEPDAELRRVAAAGKLRDPAVLREQADRLLADARSQRFVEAFLDYWLDLRKSEATSPDAALYPDYYLDDFLTESAVDESRAFFAELIHSNLPARHVVASNFTMLNSRLAAHYGLPPVEGVALRKVPLPPDAVRGGLMTQAAVLTVTANGTTTSPVLRGVWIMERILGTPPPPPPPSVPAVEPDTRGATTIREQLDKHRDVESCNSCHVKIDPAGFALESFDVLGGFREQYRALGEGEKPPGFGKNGQPFEFHYAKPVDASGELPDGRKFADVRELKKLLLEDERQIARNVTKQLVVYATGAPVGFADRPAVEAILDRAAPSGYAVKTLIHEILRSELFLQK